MSRRAGFAFAHRRHGETRSCSCSANLQGNYQLVTVGQGDLQKLTGYGFMEDVQQQQAGKMGIAPAQYQSAGWLGAGEETGVKGVTGPGGSDAFLKMFEDAVRKKADQLGLPPQTVLRNYIRGV